MQWSGVTGLQAPCAVRSLELGGICVDLATDPGSTDAGTLWRSWASAMEHLKPAKFYAEPEAIDTGFGTTIRLTRTGNPGGAPPGDVN